MNATDQAAPKSVKPRFSLIVPTVARTMEFARFIESLLAQNYADIQLIVIDQNEDERLQQYIDAIAGAFSVVHIKAPKKGASRARNVGLQNACGEIIAFPDDDCWYPPNLLARVDQWFKETDTYDILSVGAEDDAGLPSGNRWFQSVCDIAPLNALRTTFCNSLFFRSASLPTNLRFDESLFPGEETDLVLRLIRRGLRARFDRTWHVGHPRRDMLSGTVSASRAILYGRSMGILARKHRLLSLWMVLIAYDVSRAIGVALTGRPKVASYCLAHALGIFQGIWTIHPEDKAVVNGPGTT